MPRSAPDVSVVVPAYREAPNLEPLVARIDAAARAAGIRVEIIIVDDNSQDGTARIVAALGERFPVRLIVRTNQRGLSGAVLTGLRDARGDALVVMDADLQHPPEAVPAIVERLGGGDCDFVFATRYAGGGVIVEDWPLFRRIVSRVATLLARPLAPVSDPMSGFFALRREVWERAERLNPIGYKIALELLIKCRCRRPAEVPIRFAARTAGHSKLNVAEQVRYLRHLARLYRFRFPIVTAIVALALVSVLLVMAGVIFFPSRL